MKRALSETLGENISLIITSQLTYIHTAIKLHWQLYTSILQNKSKKSDVCLFIFDPGIVSTIDNNVKTDRMIPS